VNKVFKAVESVRHVLAIIPNVVDLDSPIMLSYIAEVINGTGTTCYLFHIHLSKLDIVAVVGIV